MRALLATLVALAPFAATAPSKAQPSELQQRRQQMLQISQQQRALIEQRLRCINRAKSFTELEECQRANSAGWNHGPGMGGPGMGGWGCPMW